MRALRERDGTAAAVDGPAATRTAVHPLLHLQRRAGNAALARALPVQRKIKSRGKVTDAGCEKGVASLDDDKEALLRVIDAKTQQAYDQVRAQPLFTSLATLRENSGYVGRWVETCQKKLGSAVMPATIHAQFGYAVETLTTYFLGTGAPGWALRYQVSATNTRPDIEAVKASDKSLFWVDLTSKRSVEHIWNKKRWDQGRCQHDHAEVVYPSIDQAAWNIIRDRAGKEAQDPTSVSAVVSPGELAKLQEDTVQAKRLHQARQLAWYCRFAKPLWDVTATLRTNQSKPSYDVPDPDLARRAAVMAWLNEQLDTTLNAANRDDQKDVGSILSSFGFKDVKEFGFVHGTIARSRGEAWLEEHDPDLILADQEDRIEAAIQKGKQPPSFPKLPGEEFYVEDPRFRPVTLKKKTTKKTSKRSKQGTRTKGKKRELEDPEMPSTKKSRPSDD